MRSSEFIHILAAIIILTAIITFPFALKGNWNLIPKILFFSIIIILISIFGKKIIASLLDSDIEHEIWGVYYFGLKPSWHFKKSLPAGLIIPLFFSIFSLGKLFVMTLLTYETRAKKHRAAKRFGYYSYVEMTDWHNALIGAGGIISVLILAIVLYILPVQTNLELFAKLSVYYAFWNLIPISKLDGSQIFFGSRVLYSSLAVITLILAIYALIL